MVLDLGKTYQVIARVLLLAFEKGDRSFSYPCPLWAPSITYCQSMIIVGCFLEGLLGGLWISSSAP